MSVGDQEVEGRSADAFDAALQVAANWHLAGRSHLGSLGVAADELCLARDCDQEPSEEFKRDARDFMERNDELLRRLDD